MRRLKLTNFLGLGDAYHTGASVFGGGSNLQLHTHDFYELFWIVEGSGLHCCNGLVTKVSSGYAAFIAPEDAHSLQILEGTLSLRNIAFSKQSACMVHKLLGSMPVSGLFNKNRLKGTTHVSSRLLERLNAIFEEMAVAPRTSFRLYAFIFDLLNQLQNDSKNGTNIPIPPIWLSKAISNLRRDNIARPVLAEFYRNCGRCQEHVSRECRKHYGASPLELLNQYRLKKASSLLATTEEPILNISIDCGWNNLGHFYSLFKRAYGVTPNYFRLAARRSLPSSR